MLKITQNTPSSDSPSEQEPNHITYDAPNYYLGTQAFIPKIYDAPLLGSPVPLEFNTVKIRIDGKMNGDLDWKKERQAAQNYVSQGFYLFWEMDLGLYSDFTFPISDQTQYLALCLSLEHFRDTLWKEFQARTVGICLYRGSADFSQSFKWDEEQLLNLQEWFKRAFHDEKIFADETGLSPNLFSAMDIEEFRKCQEGWHLLTLFCRDACVEYIQLLVGRLPDALQSFVLLDVSTVIDPLHQAQLLTRERYDRLHMAVKGSMLPYHELSWGSGFSSYGFIADEASQVALRQEIKVGICFPAMDKCRPSHYVGLREAIKQLLEQQIPFKIIPESMLITEWDGLDDLLFVPAGLSPQGKRKLQGFCAAGGRAIPLGEWPYS